MRQDRSRDRNIHIDCSAHKKGHGADPAETRADSHRQVQRRYQTVAGKELELEESKEEEKTGTTEERLVEQRNRFVFPDTVPLSRETTFIRKERKMQVGNLMKGIDRSMDMTEVMLMNALKHIDELEDKLDDLKDTLFYYRKVLDELKKNAHLRKSEYRDQVITMEWVYKGDWLFDELKDLFKLEEEEE